MRSKCLIIAAAAMLVAACSSSGGGGSTTGGTVTEIDALSDVPTSVVDPAQYDHTQNSTLASLSKSASVSKVQGVGGFSRAGCETDRMKKNIIRNAILPKTILCFMQAFETAGGVSAAGDNAWNQWKGDGAMGEDTGPPGVEAFQPRMAIKKSGDALTFAMCNGTTQAMELYISTANNRYTGHVIDAWGEGHSSRLDFQADGTPDDFTTATFTQSFVESNDYFAGFGSQSLEATPERNAVYGFYNEKHGQQSFAGGVYAMFDNDEGTARFSQDSGGYPAPTVQEVFQMCQQHNSECGEFENGWLGPTGWLATQCTLTLTANDRICFPMCEEGQPCCPTAAVGGTCSIEAGEGHTESFAINSSNPLALIFTVAANSSYADEVAAATIPSSSTQPTIAFTSATADVDCSTSASWTPLTFSTPPNLSECEAMQDEMDDFNPGDLCQEQEGAAAGAQ